MVYEGQNSKVQLNLFFLIFYHKPMLFIDKLSNDFFTASSDMVYERKNSKVQLNLFYFISLLSDL